MAVYQPTTNWDDVNARGGVAGTTQAPATTPYDPNAETTTTDWAGVLNRGGASGSPGQQPPTVDGGTPRTVVVNTSNDAGIAAAYKKYLGRDISADEYDYWRNVSNYESGIANSTEARQRSASTTPPADTPPTTSQPSGPPNGMNPDQYAYQKQALINAYWKYLYRLPDQAEIDAFAGKSSAQFKAHLDSIPTSWESLRAVQQRGGKTNDGAIPSGTTSTTTDTSSSGSTFTPGSMDWVRQQLGKFKSTDDPNYWVSVMAKDPKVAAGDQSAIDYWLYRMSIGDGAEAVRTGQLKPFQDGGGSGGGVSNGPTAFSDPATQQWEQLVRQLTDRLNNPMPDSAKELQQTQALDPLERQRTTMKQQTAQRLSQRGITPTSGTWEQAMSDIDRQFNELRTRTQAGFANSWAQNEDNRMLQAANLFKQIPQYQDSRLELARNTLIPTNVGSLLQMQQNGNQYDQMQSQAFWQNLAKTIADLLNQ